MSKRLGWWPAGHRGGPQLFWVHREVLQLPPQYTMAFSGGSPALRDFARVNDRCGVNFCPSRAAWSCSFFGLLVPHKPTFRSLIPSASRVCPASSDSRSSGTPRVERLLSEPHRQMTIAA